MNRPLSIELDRTEFEPGDTLTGVYSVDPESSPLATHVELAVYWATQGKGDEDRAIQYRKRGSVEEAVLFDQQGAGRFAIRLAAAPLSYDGVLVKIVWCVQVRVSFAGGGESQATAPFRLWHMGAVAEASNV